MFELPDIPLIVNFTLVPFGNAKKQSDGTFQCQHGEKECEANSYEQCAIHTNPGVNATTGVPNYWNILECMETQLKRAKVLPTPSLVTFCANQDRKDPQPILDCYDDEDLRKELNEKAYDATPSYHKYTPWVEVDHKELENQDELVKQICTVFVQKGGSPVPASCNQHKRKALRRYSTCDVDGVTL